MSMQSILLQFSLKLCLLKIHTYNKYDTLLFILIEAIIPTFEEKQQQRK